MANKSEDIMKAILSHRGVIGVLVVNPEGIPIRSTLDTQLSTNYAGLVSELCDKTRNIVKDLDPKNDLMLLRIRTRKNEVIIVPDKDYILIVIQDPLD